MIVSEFFDREKLDEVAYQILRTTITDKPTSNICVATGSSPMNLYQKWVTSDLNNDKLTLTKLDEWCGLGATDEGSCEKFIQDHLIQPLHINNYISLNGRADDFIDECQRIELALEDQPIDLCILGFGMNGHLGLNEPSDALTLETHIAKISEKTKHHDMIKDRTVDCGMTLGMKQIMRSKRILMIVSGKNKQEAFNLFMTRRLDPRCPASYLWMHDNCDVLVYTPDIK